MNSSASLPRKSAAAIENLFVLKLFPRRSAENSSKVGIVSRQDEENSSDFLTFLVS